MYQISILLIVFIIFVYLIIFNKTTDYFNSSEYTYKYGVVLCCYNRPNILEKTLNSLKKTNLQDALVCIIDDCSDDKKTKDLIDNFSLTNTKLIKKRHVTNNGISRSLLDGFSIVYPHCKYLVNIDSDVLLKKDWLIKLENCYLSAKKTNIKAKDFIVTGFNCGKCQHRIVETYPEFNVKRSIGGINMFFTREIYNLVFKGILKSARKNYGWDWRVVRLCFNLKVLLIATKPSVVQHIGNTGLNSSDSRYDIALDF